MTTPAIQDLIPDNNCFGCGPNNPGGLRLKSFWDGSGNSVARFVPQPHHCAGPPHFVNGGILATIVDCHSICTAAAAAYLETGRAIGQAPHQHFATASLALDYRRPTPIVAELLLEAEPKRIADGRYVISCVVIANQKITIEARVEAVAVSAQWMSAPQR